MNRIRKVVVGATLAAGTVAGGALGAAIVNGSAIAQESPTTTVAPDQEAPRPPRGDPGRGGHVGANGVREEALTGDTADKVTAAAQQAVPGGTVKRVETDAEGSAYEAHVETSDGKHVTVKVDADFNVTSTEEGRC